MGAKLGYWRRMGDDKNHVGATVVGATLVVAPTTVALKVDRARDRNGMAAVMYPETLRATSLRDKTAAMQWIARPPP